MFLGMIEGNLAVKPPTYLLGLPRKVLLWNITGSDVDLSDHRSPGTLTPLWLQVWSAHRIMQNDAVRPEICGSIGVFGVVMVQP